VPTAAPPAGACLAPVAGPGGCGGIGAAAGRAGAASPGPAGGAGAHPARTSASTIDVAIECAASERVDMWVIYLEAAGILVLVLALVWWTLRGKK
jgi:hypothetical protein